MAAEFPITATTSSPAKPSFHAQQAVLLTPEDHQAFDVLVTEFRLELHPVGPVERALYAEIVLAAWNIGRTNRLEVALASDGIDPLLSDENERPLARVATYRMRAERTFHKCLKELRAYQAAHPVEEPVLPNKAKSGKPEVKNEPKLVEFNSSVRTPNDPPANRPQAPHLPFAERTQSPDEGLRSSKPTVHFGHEKRYHPSDHS